MKLFKFLLILLMVFISTSLINANELNIDVNNSQNNNLLEINYFYTPTCPACSQMSPVLKGFEEKYDFLTVNYYNISSSREISNLFEKFLDDYNVPSNQSGYVPTVFIKNKFFVGYTSEIPNNIENIIIEFSGGESLEPTETEKDVVLQTKVLGLWTQKISLGHSLFITTFLLGFFDSLNVCSITVLIFLIIYLLSIGSLKKAFKLGLIYTIVIYLFYFLFMLILSSVIGLLILSYGVYIRWIIVVISLLIGLLLIKDFFFYGKGITVGVPKSVKPLLEKHLKKATVISAIIFAILASIVELPCTAVFPLVYSTVLAESSIIGLQRLLWIALYNLIYIIPLLVVVFGTYFSWIKIENIDQKMQKNKKILKLIAGVLLLLIALYFGYPLII